MTSELFDEFWGLSNSKVRSRKGRNIHGGIVRLNTLTSKQTSKGRLIAAVKKTPEVMVKARRGGRNLSKIKANFDYISRNGKLEVEDENGHIYLGKSDMNQLKSNWKNEGYRIPDVGEKKAEAFNLILSMPAGTDRNAVKNASREFAKSVFSKNQYIFVSHEDEPHPHVHLAVKMVNKNGIRINPRKHDLQKWREIFVDKLSEQGIEANATPKNFRGVIKSYNQSIKHIPEEKRALASEILTSKNASKNKSIMNAEKKYSDLAKKLVNGSSSSEDKKLALNIVEFVNSWQPQPQPQNQNIEKIKNNQLKVKEVKR